MNPDLLYGAGMNELYFSTGQAAEELGITHDDVRRLYQARLIDGEITPGGQLRFPQAEVERLKASGIPQLPRPLPGDRARASMGGTGTSHPGLLAEPSAVLVESAEEVARLGNEVKALRLNRRKELEMDWFRKREREEAERLAAQQEAERARAEAERQQREAQRQAERAQQEAARAKRQHEDWLDSWESYALRSVPSDAPPEVKLEVHEAVRKRLLDLQPVPAREVTEKLVDALVGKAVASWRRMQEIKGVLVEARDAWLPCLARRWSESSPLTSWQVRAVRGAGDAIDQFLVRRSDAPLEEIRAVAKQAVAVVTQEFEHTQSCEKLVEGLWAEVQDATADELEGAREAVRKALAALPPTASQRDRESARDGAIADLRQQIAARQAEQKRREVEKQQRFQAMLRLIYLNDSICGELIRLERNGELDALEVQERLEMTNRLEKKLRPILTEKLVHGPFMNHDDLMKRIGRLVDEHLDEVLELAD